MLKSLYFLRNIYIYIIQFIYSYLKNNFFSINFFSIMEEYLISFLESRLFDLNIGLIYISFTLIKKKCLN